MLQSMRAGSQSFLMKFILFGLLFMALAGLAMMDVQGVVQNAIGGSTTVAKIDKNKISALEFSQLVDSQLQQQRIPRSEAVRMGLPQQILANEVSRRVLTLAARDAGVAIDDVIAAKEIKSMLHPLLADGMTEEDALGHFLRSTGYNEGNMITAVKTQMATDTFIDLLSGGALPSEQLTKAVLDYQFEQRRADYFTISAAKAEKTQKEPTEEELQIYYNTAPSMFMRPEYRSFSVLIVNEKNLNIPPPELTEEDLRNHFNTHKGSFATAETRLIHQAIANDQETALRILEKARDRGLKAATEDKASYIMPQTLAAKDLPEEMSGLIFSAEQGDYIGPVETPLGWHLAYIERIIPGETPAFEDIKNQIQKTLTKEMTIDAFYERINDIDDMLAAGSALSEVAAENNLRATAFKALDKNGKTQDGTALDTDIANLTPLLEQVFSLEDTGIPGQLIETKNGDYMVTQVDSIIAPEKHPFEDVKDDVRQEWKQQSHANALSALVTKINNRIKGGKTFDNLAKEYGSTIQKTAFLKRQATEEKTKLPADFVQTLFSLSKTGDSAAIQIQDNITVLRFADRKTKIDNQDKEQKASLEASLKRSLQGEILDQYGMYLMAEYDVKMNFDLVQRMYTGEEAE